MWTYFYTCPRVPFNRWDDSWGHRCRGMIDLNDRRVLWQLELTIMLLKMHYEQCPNSENVVLFYTCLRVTGADVATGTDGSTSTDVAPGTNSVTGTDEVTGTNASPGTETANGPDIQPVGACDTEEVTGKPMRSPVPMRLPAPMLLLALKPPMAWTFNWWERVTPRR